MLFECPTYEDLRRAYGVPVTPTPDMFKLPQGAAVARFIRAALKLRDGQEVVRPREHRVCGTWRVASCMAVGMCLVAVLLVIAFVTQLWALDAYRV